MAIDLNSFDVNRPAPPSTLFKYLHPDRLDVLTHGFIRFTPPLNTNDIFEVRQTFDLFSGPKMKELFEIENQSIDIDKLLNEQLVQSGLPFSLDEFKYFILNIYGIDSASFAQVAVKEILAETIYPMMNSPKVIDELLERLGSRQLCLSLTEKMDSSPMWAHYADNSKGFVIALDTDKPFFKRGDSEERQGLHKVTYFDGRMAEMIDSPYEALISKQADWAYEREWRLYTKAEDADRVISKDDDDIHLIAFPTNVVNRVILGIRSSSSLEENLKAIIAKRFPHVRLTSLTADRASTSLTETTV
jgi:Protein of unknown function (DUF2971)